MTPMILATELKKCGFPIITEVHCHAKGHIGSKKTLQKVNTWKAK